MVLPVVRAPWMASRMVISAHPKILLQLIQKDQPGGPGARVQEKVLEVPAQEGSRARELQEGARDLEARSAAAGAASLGWFRNWPFPA